MKTVALVAGLAVAMLVAGKASACTAGPVNLKVLSARSDIVAVGSIRVLKELAKEDGPASRTMGVARFDATDVILNRTTRSRPFQFEYEHLDNEGCFPGTLASKDGRVKIYLRESVTLPRKLQLLYVEGAE
jgi:hypothetical protein